MNQTAVYVSTVLMWIAVIAGLYQRIFAMPKWFADAPKSFELIRRQSKNAKRFWIPLSVAFIGVTIIALAMNLEFPAVRNYILAALGCYALTGALSWLYFVKEVISFTEIAVNAPHTPELKERIDFWLRWTTVRDVLMTGAAIFLSLACFEMMTRV